MSLEMFKEDVDLSQTSSISSTLSSFSEVSNDTFEVDGIQNEFIQVWVNNNSKSVFEPEPSSEQLSFPSFPIPEESSREVDSTEAFEIEFSEESQSMFQSSLIDIGLGFAPTTSPLASVLNSTPKVIRRRSKWKRPQPLPVTSDFVDDFSDWGIPQQANNPPSPSTSTAAAIAASRIERLRRKRRAANSPDSGSTLDSPSGRKNFAGDFAVQCNGNGIYDALRMDESFQRLIFHYIPQYNIRSSIAQVSTDWLRISYENLRQRFGNKVFTALWAVESSANPINLEQHIHPSFIQKEDHSRVREESHLQELDKIGTMVKVKENESLAQVTTILSFGNLAVEQNLIKADDEHRLPDVENFVYITGLGNFFITPDFSTFGDSFSGINGAKKISGGSFLTSIFFPHCTHFKLDTYFLPMTSDGVGSSFGAGITEYQKDKCSPWLTAKALLSFKIYDDDETSEWLKNLTNGLLEDGAPLFPVISGRYSYVGTNLIKDRNTFTTSIGVALMGSQYTNARVVEIDMTNLAEQAFQFKFEEMSWFINGEFEKSSKWNGFKMTHFALLFCNENLVNGGEAVAADFVHVRKILQEFHQRFPLVPLQGISSFAEVEVKEAKNKECVSNVIPKVGGDSGNDADTEMEGLQEEMERMMLLIRDKKQETMKKKVVRKKVAILIVKHPLAETEREKKDGSRRSSSFSKSKFIKTNTEIYEKDEEMNVNY